MTVWYYYPVLSDSNDFRPPLASGHL